MMGKYLPPLRVVRCISGTADTKGLLTKTIFIQGSENNRLQQKQEESMTQLQASWMSPHRPLSLGQWCNVSHFFLQLSLRLDMTWQFFSCTSGITMRVRNEGCEDTSNTMKTVIWGRHDEKGPCNLDEILESMLYSVSRWSRCWMWPSSLLVLIREAPCTTICSINHNWSQLVMSL